MNETQWLKSLDTPPTPVAVDVAPQVMQAIRESDTGDSPVFRYAAAAAVAAGVIAVLLGMPALTGSGGGGGGGGGGADPLAGIADTFNLVLQ